MKDYNPHFMIIPSLSCPAACSYCFGPNTGPTMSVEIAGKVIDYIGKIAEELHVSQLNVTFHGGEPLCAGHEVLEYFIANLSHRFPHLSMYVQSNLWLLDDAYCEVFKRYGVGVGTSIDGPKELNDSQRGDGYFDQTMAGIRLAQRHGIGVGCIATFTANTLHKWRDVFDFFLANQLDFSIHPSVSSIRKASDLAVSSEEYAQLLQEMFRYYLKTFREISVGTFNHICRSIADGQGHICTFKDCFGMFLAIDPNGDIFPCQRFAGQEPFRLGTIFNRPSFQDLAGSDFAIAMQKREEALRAECCDCEHYGCCKGGCAYNAMNNPDQTSRKDPYCGAYKAFFSDIKDRLFQEAISDRNVAAIQKYGPAIRGNPLYRAGDAIELAKETAHPKIVARNAKRIIAAYELGRERDTEKVAKKLVGMRISKTPAAARHSLERLIESLKPSRSLYKLYLHITWNCQLACTHCYASGNTAAEMCADHIKTIVRQGSSCGFKEIVITGGEPLIHAGRVAYMEMLSDLRTRDTLAPIVLRTNFAMELTANDFMHITQAFDEVVVSIDGDEISHDARRGAGSYQKSVDTMKRYIAWGHEHRIRLPRLGVSASLPNDEITRETGASVKRLAQELGVKVKFRPLLPMGRARESGLTIQPFKGYLSVMDLVETGFRPTATCGMGQNLYVEPTGESFPCYAFHKTYTGLGNVLERGLENVVESDAFVSLSRHNVDSNQKCKTCVYRYLCGGACRAWSGESAQYDFDAAPAECESLKNRAKALYEFSLAYLNL